MILTCPHRLVIIPRRETKEGRLWRTGPKGITGDAGRIPLLHFECGGLAVPLQKRHICDILGRTKIFSHAYDTSMTIIVTKPGIIIDVVGSYFYDKKS